MNQWPLYEKGSAIMTATHRTTDPKSVALDVLGRLEAAWNDADGLAYGGAYSPDASFVNIRGEHVAGREAIGAGHDAILHTIHAGSRNEMALVRADRIAEGVVLAVSLNTLECPAGPLAGRHQAMSTSVITRAGHGDGRWQIISTHNTLVTA
jgi:uncharacterized protein (TIGR02246 family)